VVLVVRRRACWVVVWDVVGGQFLFSTVSLWFALVGWLWVVVGLEAWNGAYKINFCRDGYIGYTGSFAKLNIIIQNKKNRTKPIPVSMR